MTCYTTSRKQLKVDKNTVVHVFYVRCVSCIKSHLMYDHFKKYSGVLVYFKTSRCKLQPWPQVLEKIPHFSNAALLPSVASIIPTLNRDAEEISGGGVNPHKTYTAMWRQQGRDFRAPDLERGIYFRDVS